METKIRPDFESVKVQLTRLLVYSEQADEFNIKDWSHLKSKEDYRNVYGLDPELRVPYEKIYEDGRNLALWISLQFSSFNDVGKYPTLKAFVESFEGSWIYQIEELKVQTKQARDLIEQKGSPWAVEKMVGIFESEIAIMEAAVILVDELKRSELYSRESRQRIPSNNSNTSLALIGNFTPREVSNSINELKSHLADIDARDGFKQLEKQLPRLAHILTKNAVLIEIRKELPETKIQEIIDFLNDPNQRDKDYDFPVEPKRRLSEQVEIIIAIGQHKLNLWEFSERFWRGAGHRFWQEILLPVKRDFLRFVLDQQSSFLESQKSMKTITPLQPNKRKTYELDLFISHSSKDKRLAKSLIELLRTALAIPADRVRCTSVDGYKLSGGAKTEMELRKEIAGAKCFIGLITLDSLASQFVLFELGARWGLDEHFVPVLGGGIKASALRPPLADRNALNSASKSEMEQLVHELAGILKRKLPLPTIYRSQLSTLMKINAKT